MYNTFIKLTSIYYNYSQDCSSIKSKTLIAVDQIMSIVEEKDNCKIILKGNYCVYVVETFDEVEKRLKTSMGGTGQTLMV